MNEWMNEHCMTKGDTLKTLSTWHNERNTVTAVVELPPAYTHLNNATDRQMIGGNVITGIGPPHRVNRTKLRLLKIQSQVKTLTKLS
jgi:hypothetical protein